MSPKNLTGNIVICLDGISQSQITNKYGTSVDFVSETIFCPNLATMWDFEPLTDE